MSQTHFTRRELLAFAGAAPLARGEELPPVRAITRGPKFHWFGYYDKLQVDPTNRYALGMEVDFEHRSPRAEDEIRLGMVDLKADDRWTEIGRTTAWCWQQGCMLQWLPGSRTEVIYNDREKGRYISRILDVKTRKTRALPGPIYALSHDAKWAFAPDFRRLADMRPGYGYNGIPDPYKDVPAPEEAGIWRMNLRTGEIKLIFSFAAATRIPWPRGEMKGAKHWFNHLLVSPDNRRLIVLHRFKPPQERRWNTRMFTINPDGTAPHIVDDYGGMSHFIWRDATHILGWANRPPLGGRMYLYEDRTEKVEAVGDGVITRDGHCTYLPGNRWILADTYPDRERNQNPYLFDTRTGKLVPLGHFRLPPEYKDEWRCDTHPRQTPDGKTVIIDSPHGGNGRQMWAIDISRITA